MEVLYSAFINIKKVISKKENTQKEKSVAKHMGELQQTEFQIIIKR